MAFDAAYPSGCAKDCTARIKVDDLIERALSGAPLPYQHVSCPPEPVLAPPCPRCFMVPATNGLCGCDQ